MIKDIVYNGCCLGCGLCSSVLGQDKCKMSLHPDGFYYPVLTDEQIDDQIVKDLCPGILVKDQKTHGVWGHVEMIAEAWATDNELRYKAASGGVSSALALFLLESKKVDRVLQVGLQGDSFLYNELKISASKEEIMQNAQSRYAPALTLHRLKQILDGNHDKYGFVGKPCDIAAIKNFIQSFPEYQGRIPYTISIFCAGMPSYNASQKTWEQSGRKDKPNTLKYRGDGWPGNFKVTWNDGGKYEITYNESWGKILGRNLNFRCKICPDGIGLLADISVGDSWNTKDGYPDFTEAEGRNFCFIRTSKGVGLFNDAIRAGYISKKDLDISDIMNMQRYQYDRRHFVGWRILAMNLVTLNFLRFEGLGLISLALKSNYKRGVKEVLGTIRRFLNNRKKIKLLYS